MGVLYSFFTASTRLRSFSHIDSARRGSFLAGGSLHARSARPKREGFSCCFVPPQPHDWILIVAARRGSFLAGGSLHARSARPEQQAGKAASSLSAIDSARRGSFLAGGSLHGRSARPEQQAGKAASSLSAIDSARRGSFLAGGSLHGRSARPEQQAGKAASSLRSASCQNSHRLLFLAAGIGPRGSIRSVPPFALAHDSINQPRLVAIDARRVSGLTATG